MKMQDILSSWLQTSSRREFTLVIAGRTSGIRDTKTTQRPRNYLIAGQKLRIGFDQAASLTVSNPSHISVGPEGELAIGDATEARFVWRSQSRPVDSKTLCEEVFLKLGSTVKFSRTGAPFETRQALMYSGSEFVKLV